MVTLVEGQCQMWMVLLCQGVEVTLRAFALSRLVIFTSLLPVSLESIIHTGIPYQSGSGRIGSLCPLFPLVADEH